jgi:hypothetical protein
MAVYKSIILFLSGLAAGCSADVTVPNDRPVDGCYKNGGLNFTLRDGKVYSNEKAVALFARGNNEAGSFIEFKPALHILKRGDSLALAVDRGLPANYVMTVMEHNRVTILMPQDPLGQIGFSLGCQI